MDDHVLDRQDTVDSAFESPDLILGLSGDHVDSNSTSADEQEVRQPAWFRHRPDLESVSLHCLRHTAERTGEEIDVGRQASDLAVLVGRECANEHRLDTKLPKAVSEVG
ncbi:MAG: hypothetical protein ACR2HP_15265 [Ilumatobacteraceae bacterium]